MHFTGSALPIAELTDTHADEFAHAVQIGSAITQKRVLDVILQAVMNLAGGGRAVVPRHHRLRRRGSPWWARWPKTGRRVTLETAPLKYRGLSYTEIWISEAQGGRMVMPCRRTRE